MCENFFKEMARKHVARILRKAKESADIKYELYLQHVGYQENDCLSLALHAKTLNEFMYYISEIFHSYLLYKLKRNKNSKVKYQYEKQVNRSVFKGEVANLDLKDGAFYSENKLELKMLKMADIRSKLDMMQCDGFLHEIYVSQLQDKLRELTNNTLKVSNFLN